MFYPSSSEVFRGDSAFSVNVCTVAPSLIQPTESRARAQAVRKPRRVPLKDRRMQASTIIIGPHRSTGPHVRHRIPSGAAGSIGPCVPRAIQARAAGRVLLAWLPYAKRTLLPTIYDNRDRAAAGPR